MFWTQMHDVGPRTYLLISFCLLISYYVGTNNMQPYPLYAGICNPKDFASSITYDID